MLTNVYIIRYKAAQLLANVKYKHICLLLFCSINKNAYLYSRNPTTPYITLHCHRQSYKKKLDYKIKLKNKFKNSLVGKQ